MIRIFVGCSANHEDAESQAVLEYTIRARSSEPVEITWMKLSRDPSSPFYSNTATGEGWITQQWATPFTGFRWVVPELCGFEGKAIYMDSDVIVRADIDELWRQEFMPAKVVIAKGDVVWRFCVSLWNCAAAERFALHGDELRGRPDGHRFMTRQYSRQRNVVQSFVGNWNCLDGEGYEDIRGPEIKAIHYTSMRHQPHLKYATERLARSGGAHWFDGEPADHWRPDLQELFDREFRAALAAGYTAEQYCRDPLFGEYVKASTAKQGLKRPAWGATI